MTRRRAADAGLYSHHCGFPCAVPFSQVTSSVCTGCLTGRLCPVRNDDDEEDR